jgi:hypothetical protein
VEFGHPEGDTGPTSVGVEPGMPDHYTRYEESAEEQLVETHPIVRRMLGSE